MDPNEGNESPGQNQAQGGPAEPGVMQQESPRVCKVCGGPNHHGCGCEAKQLLEAERAGLTEREAKALHEAQETEVTKAMGLQEVEPQPDQEPSAEEIARVYKSITGQNIESALNFDKRLFENLENLSVAAYDIVNLLKLISQESMAVRVELQKMEAKMNNAKEIYEN